MYDLFIGNKNYSSWSLRPWVLMRELNIPFREKLVPFGGADNPDAFRGFSPTGKVPCLVDGNGVQPTHIGALPPQLAALIRTNVNVQELTVEAALTGRREHVYHAAMLDPHTAAELDLDQIHDLVDALLDAHGDWGPQLH